MHVPDGLVSAPVAIGAGVASLAAVGYSTRRATRELGERTIPLLGVTAAFIFAAQMLNFPVAGGTSGHFLGAMLAAALMGPYAAVIVMTVVLLVQAIGMADGGITALGVNVLNMAVVGGLLSYLLFLTLKRLLPKSSTGYFSSLAVASWLSVVLAAAACSLELAISGTVPLRVALPAMISVHMIIGLGEALITTTVVAAVLATRPDLVKTYDLPRTSLARPGGAFGKKGRMWGFVAGAVVVALALAVFVSPFASGSPDGLEKVAEDKGFGHAAAEEPAWNSAPLKDYAFPGIGSEGVATGVAGGIGTLALFGLVMVAGRAFGRRTSPAAVPALGSAAGGVGSRGTASIRSIDNRHEHADHRHAGHQHTGHDLTGEAARPEDAPPEPAAGERPTEHIDGV